MADIPVLGTGPIALTVNGAYLTIPLDLLTFKDGAINADKWPLYKGATNATKDTINNLLKYLVSQDMLTSAAVAVAPAFMLEAAQPGTAGNKISVKIDTVTTGNPKSNTEIKAEVTITKTWSGLTPDTVADTIGNSPDAGLVYVKSTGDLTKTPAPLDGSLLDAGGALVDLPVKDGQASAVTVFTLAAPADSGSPTAFSVKLVTDPPPPPDPDADPGADPPAPTFSLTVTWEKTATVKLSDFNAQFGHVVTSKPPNGGFVSDPATGTTTLSGGADTTPPVKATGVVASA